jgi:hypothetical protein
VKAVMPHRIGSDRIGSRRGGAKNRFDHRSTGGEIMPGSIAYRVLRGLVYRSHALFLYLAYLGLKVVAFLLLVGALAVIADPGGLRSHQARHHVAFWQRVTMGAVHAAFGGLAALGSRALRSQHRRINPLDPEMQVSFRTARSAAGVRRSDGSPYRFGGSMMMYDRELDGGL